MNTILHSPPLNSADLLNIGTPRPRGILVAAVKDSHHPGGGPAGRPVFVPAAVSSVQGLGQHGLGNGEGVRVYVLDTELLRWDEIIDVDSPDKAKLEWEKEDPYFRCDCLASESGTGANHGNFVADIIRDMAGAATIIGVKTLNSCNVGTAEWLWYVLHYLKQDLLVHKECKKIVNMSFVIKKEIPESDSINDLPDFYNMIFESLLTIENTLFFAAAGNEYGVDAYGGGHFPMIPASLKGIHAVGALEHNGEGFVKASYSNHINSDGIWAFGGGRDASETSVGGFIGSYDTDAQNLDLATATSLDVVRMMGNSTSVESIPLAEAVGTDASSDTISAMWSGTSFATARVSGLVAAAWSTERTADNPVQAVREYLADRQETL